MLLAVKCTGGEKKELGTPVRQRKTLVSVGDHQILLGGPLGRLRISEDTRQDPPNVRDGVRGFQVADGGGLYESSYRGA